MSYKYAINDSVSYKNSSGTTMTGTITAQTTYVGLRSYTINNNIQNILDTKNGFLGERSYVIGKVTTTAMPTTTAKPTTYAPTTPMATTYAPTTYAPTTTA